MMAAFEQVYHGIQFAIPDDGYYETQDGLSWGVNPTYSHDWNKAAAKSSSRSAAAKRRRCRRSADRRSSRVISGPCLSRPAILIALRCQKSLPRKSAPAISVARRAISLISACSPRDRSTRRSSAAIVVLKLWQARDNFDPRA